MMMMIMMTMMMLRNYSLTHSVECCYIATRLQFQTLRHFISTARRPHHRPALIDTSQLRYVREWQATLQSRAAAAAASSLSLVVAAPRPSSPAEWSQHDAGSTLECLATPRPLLTVCTRLYHKQTHTLHFILVKVNVISWAARTVEAGCVSDRPTLGRGIQGRRPSLHRRFTFDQVNYYIYYLLITPKQQN